MADGRGRHLPLAGWAAPRACPEHCHQVDRSEASRQSTFPLDVSGGFAMPEETTYTHARANLAALCDEVISTREPIIIHRRGAEDVALVAAAELRSLMVTANLLGSTEN